jgi:hypothetical protein
MEVMTGAQNKQQEALDRLDDILVNDILSASDGEILAEAREDGIDPDAVAAEMRALFDQTAAADGKARLAAAKAAAAAERHRPATVIPLEPAAARRLLDRALVRDPETASKLTLAARKFKGAVLSDEEVRGLLEDFQELGALPPSEEPETDA